MSTGREEWRAIPGYEGLYEVSDCGRVRSLDRTVPKTGGHGVSVRVKGRELKAYKTRDYDRMSLSKNNQLKRIFVHRVVLLAFVGPCPDGMQVRHLDGNPNNNALVNLAYGTPSENVYDTVRHGTHHMLNVTHCKHGHEFTPETTMLWCGKRRCRPCHLVYTREQSRRRRAKQKVQREAAA